MSNGEENDTGLDGKLSVRINQGELDIFESKAERITGEPKASAMIIRKMVTAFNDGRLRIIPTPDEKNLITELYKV